MSYIPAPTLSLQTAAYALPDRRHVAFLPLHFVVTGLVLVAGLTAIGLQAYEPATSHDPIAFTCGLATIGLIVYTRYFLRLPWLSGSVVYLILFWMFHFGLTFTAVLVPDVLAPMEDAELEWMSWPNVRLAMILSLLGAAGFVFGLGLFRARPAVQDVEAGASVHDSALYAIGWLVMLVGLAGSVFVLLRNGGLGVFSLDYLQFRSSVLGATNLQTFLDLAQIGCVLAICAAGSQRWVAPLTVWTVVGGVPLLLLGLRAGTMIPLVTFMVLLTRRGIRLPRWLLVAALLTSLIALPAIKAFRIVGFGNRSHVNWTDVTPLDTLVELGGSLQAVAAYVGWIQDGEEYLLGASYWAPFDRQVLVRVVPGREPIPYLLDERVPARLMFREGAVGLSATGEAYFNFGPVGPVLFFGCVGALFGWLERRTAATPYRCAALGMVMFLFYFNIRGDWLALPAQLASYLALLWLCYVYGRLVRPVTDGADPQPL